MTSLTEQRAVERETSPTGTHGPFAVNIEPGERWFTLAAGLGLAMVGLRQRFPWNVALVTGSGYLIHRAQTGHCSLYESMGIHRARQTTSRLEACITSRGAREEAFRIWKDFQRLPAFMEHLARVTVTGPGRSHWTTKAPGGILLDWDAEIVQERPDELIAWRSLPGGSLETIGEVRFLDAPDHRGTEIHVRIEYVPPLGLVGQAGASLLHRLLTQYLQNDLGRFQCLLDNGEIPTFSGQNPSRETQPAEMSVPAASHPPIQEPVLPHTGSRAAAQDNVEEASEDSFPASDPPGWTGTASGHPSIEAGDRGTSSP